MVYCARSVLCQFIIILKFDIFNVIMSGGDEWVWHTDSLFFYFVLCLNFVTNTMFRMSGLRPSSAKEARNLMDPNIKLFSGTC